jgi:glutathione S-transferase
MSVEPTLYGAAYSVYVRAVRLALEEKGVAYRLVPVDVFSDDGVPADHLERHPFGRIPAFEYRGFRLYEANAITRYVDEAFAGASLQPRSPEDRARVNQVISILDSYAYRSLVWDIYVERVSAPKRNRVSDEARIQAALPRARVCLTALEQIMGEGPFLTGPDLTLADLHAAPMFAYFVQAPEGRALLESHGSVRTWWEMMATRASVMATVPVQ